MELVTAPTRHSVTSKQSADLIHVPAIWKVALRYPGVACDRVQPMTIFDPILANRDYSEKEITRMVDFPVKAR